MTAPTSERKPPRWRSLAALIVFLLAVIGTPAALIGHWGHRTLTDQPTYIATIGPLAADPQVQEAVADTLSEAIVAQVDTGSAVTSFLDSLLPGSRLTDTLASPITAGINSLINQLVLQFLASDVFQTVWLDVTRASQESFVAILEGKSEGPIRVEGNQLVLDISDLVIKVQERLVDSGVGLAASVTIEPGKRQIVLAEPAGLAQIQFIYRFASPVLAWSLLLLALGYGIAALLARNRPRMVIASGIAVLAWAGILTVALNQGQESFVNRLSTTPLAVAAETFWVTFFQNLMSGLGTLAVAGVILIISGWLATQTALAGQVRAWFCTAAGHIQDSLPEGLGSEWFTRNLVWMRVAAVAIAVAVFVFTDALSMSWLLWSTLLGAILLFVVQVIGQPRTSQLVATG